MSDELEFPAEVVELVDVANVVRAAVVPLAPVTPTPLPPATVVELPPLAITTPPWLFTEIVAPLPPFSVVACPGDIVFCEFTTAPLPDGFAPMVLVPMTVIVTIRTLAAVVVVDAAAVPTPLEELEANTETAPVEIVVAVVTLL